MGGKPFSETSASSRFSRFPTVSRRSGHARLQDSRAIFSTIPLAYFSGRLSRPDSTNGPRPLHVAGDGSPCEQARPTTAETNRPTPGRFEQWPQMRSPDCEVLCIILISKTEKKIKN